MIDLINSPNFRTYRDIPCPDPNPQHQQLLGDQPFPLASLIQERPLKPQNHPQCPPFGVTAKALSDLRAVATSGLMMVLSFPMIPLLHQFFRWVPILNIAKRPYRQMQGANICLKASARSKHWTVRRQLVWKFRPLKKWWPHMLRKFEATVRFWEGRESVFEIQVFFFKP